jgi:CBS-domain-containing membrane protein
VSAFVASFCGIAIIAALHFHVPLVSGFYAPGLAWQWLIGSFGASAVLLYAVPESPLSQPRNLLVGHVGSAIVGATINVILPFDPTRWLACALAVSCSILFMQLTRTVHPPGGATAFTARRPRPGLLLCYIPRARGCIINVADCYDTE